MKVLYFHQFYAGPEAPGPRQPRDLVQLLAERGHKVEVVACDLNAYNEQTEPEEQFSTDAGGSVRVYRLPVPRGLRTSLRHRLQTYGRFAWSAYQFGRKRLPPDTVMATIQPLFTGVAALQLARRWKKPLLLEIRDLWPDALVVKKAIAPWQAVPLHAMARSLYFGADRVVSLTPGIKMELLKKGVPAARLDLFPNGFDEALFQVDSEVRNRIREQMGWGNQFTAVYTGSLTEVTAVDTIVQAAAHLRERKDIRIDIFGFGQRKADAMALAMTLDLHNIRFHEPVSKTQVPAILSAADAALMTLFRSPLIHIYFESKLIDYLGSRLPILGAMDGVQTELIRRAGAGRTVQAFDHEGLARLIMHSADHAEERQAQGEAGYRFVKERLLQRTILEHYVLTLESVARREAEALPVWDPFEGLLDDNLPKGFSEGSAK